MAQRYEWSEWTIVADDLSPETGREYSAVHPDRAEYTFVLDEAILDGGSYAGGTWDIYPTTDTDRNGTHYDSAQMAVIDYLTEEWECDVIIPTGVNA